jgi:hypothetical protein
MKLRSINYGIIFQAELYILLIIFLFAVLFVLQGISYRQRYSVKLSADVLTNCKIEPQLLERIMNEYPENYGYLKRKLIIRHILPVPDNLNQRLSELKTSLYKLSSLKDTLSRIEIIIPNNALYKDFIKVINMFNEYGLRYTFNVKEDKFIAWQLSEFEKNIRHEYYTM